VRIACIANSWVPSIFANSLQVMKMSEAFAKIGHDVTLFVGISDKDEVQLEEGDVFSFYGVENIFEVKKLPVSNNFTQAQISSFYAKYKSTDVCYTRSIYAACITPRLGIPTIFEADNPVRWRLDKQFVPLVLDSHNLRILSISNTLTNFYVQRYKIIPQKIITIPNGVDLESFDLSGSKEDLRRTLGLPQDKKIICYSGSLYNGRGIELLLSTSRKLPQETLLLIVGGSASDINRYQKMSNDMGCRNVSFVGFLPPNKVPKYLLSSDILVMPYESNAEDPAGNIQSLYMSPMKMFEYMAAGRPIITSRIDAITDILSDRENAVFFDALDEESFINAIKDVLYDEELSRKIAGNARNDVRKYSWTTRANDSISFIQSSSYYR